MEIRGRIGSMRCVVRSTLDPSSKRLGHGTTPWCSDHVTRTMLCDIPQGDTTSSLRCDITATLQQ
jgi:hypothetical protein